MTVIYLPFVVREWRGIISFTVCKTPDIPTNSARHGCQPELMPIMDELWEATTMSDNLPQEWGHLDDGSEVTDIDIHAVYFAHKQDDVIVLTDRTTKQRLSFASATRIDHQRYKFRLPS